MAKELVSKQDRMDWHLHAGVIRRGKDQVAEFHTSLVEIRNRKLWRVQYESWEDFCRVELDYSDRHANRVIAGSKLIAALPAPEKAQKGPRGPKPPSKGSKTTIPTSPATETQARELARLGDDPDAHSEAFSEAIDVAGGEQPTAAQVREIVDARLGDVPLDGQGQPVTNPKLRDAFLARVKLKKATDHLAAARELVKAVIGTPGGEHIVPAETTIRIGATRERIAENMPYAVCSACEGVRPEACDRCTSRGWITKSEAA